MNLQENIHRIKEMMGVINEEVITKKITICLTYPLTQGNIVKTN